MSRLIFSFLLLVGSLVALAGHAKSMTKTDLIAFVASRAGLSPTQAAKAIDAMFDGITQTLVDGGQVRIVDFGTFAVIRRPQRSGRDPRTGERLVIPAYNAPKFKAGKGLKDAVKSAPMAAPTDKPQDEGMLREPRGEAPSDPGQVLKVTDESFEHDVLKAPGPLLLEFWAEWSGPSKMMAPALEEIVVEMLGRLTVAKINIDENPITSQKYGVRGIPTLMLFKDGDVAAEKVGALSKDQLVDWVDSLL